MRKLSRIVLELLRKKGITDEADIEEYISSSPQRTYSPFLMHNMEEGVNLVLKYIDEGKKICIYGDYDADGITSVAIMMQTLSILTDNVFYYIPSRFDEGYGLNRDAVKGIYEKGTDLIVTVDCGCVSADEVAYAKSLGMEILVTDHHNMETGAADCLIINPKQRECKYPFKGLAGCGVAFKFCCAVQQKANLDRKAIKDILDLVAIGTIGDIVPLVDENRTLVKYGLHAIREGRRKGLKELFLGLNVLPESADEGMIAYRIVPHLNAAGRMEDASLGAQLLMNGDAVLAERLIQINSERKRVQNDTYNKCVDDAEKQSETRNSIIIKCDEAHEGITGIVAGKLREKYHKPVIIVTPSDGGLKGTGRSISGVDLYELLKDSSDCFIKFGGHRAACGFTMREDCFDRFFDEIETRLSAAAAETPEMMNDTRSADMIIPAGEIDMDFVRELECLSPYGHGNEKPLFCIENVCAEDVRYMGADGTHVRFNACEANGKIVKCVLFNRAQDFTVCFESGRKLNIVGTLEISEWRNHFTPQMIVSDICF